VQGLLKISLQKSADLDRRLEAFSRSLFHCLERGLKEGLLKVYSYPTPDALIASSLLVSRSLIEGIRASVKVTPRPPQEVRDPMILIGFPSLNYRSSSIKECLLAVSYEGKLTTPPPGAVYAEVEGSLTASITLSFITEGWKGSRTLKALSLVGTYSSPYVDKIGRIHGLDSILVEGLSDLGPTMITSLKVYKPQKLPLCKAISSTLDPYYPDLTGNEESCKRLLEMSKEPDLIERLPSSFTADELTKISKILLEHISSFSRRKIDPSEYFGGILVLAQPPEDPKMAADALLSASEALRDPSTYLAIFVDFENEYQVFESFLLEETKKLGSDILNVKPKRVKGPGWLRIFAVDLYPSLITLIYRALRLLGLVEEESVLVIEEDGNFYASPFQVEEALGYGAVRRLIEAKVATFDKFFLKLNIGEY
jgi:hypothetical protein